MDALASPRPTKAPSSPPSCCKGGLCWPTPAPSASPPRPQSPETTLLCLLLAMALDRGPARPQTPSAPRPRLAPASPTPGSLPPKPHASATATANHMRVASQRDDAPNSDERSSKRQANSTESLSGVSSNISEDTNMTAPPPGPSDQYHSDLPKVPSTVNPSDVLSKTLSTLYQKLEEIRQAIAACQDVRELHQLLSALGECMQAIQRAHSLANLQPSMML